MGGSDVGEAGPFFATICLAQGREADTVGLVMSPPQDESEDQQELQKTLEEGRVYYVGATRARSTLVTTLNGSKGVSYLESGRPYRILRPSRAQLEIGRKGDVNLYAALGWDCALHIQARLASWVGKSVPTRARSTKENDYAFRL